MASKDIKLKDQVGNFLFPLANKDSDGNIIRYTYIKHTYDSQIIKNTQILYAKNKDATTAPEDKDFSEAPPEWEPGCYIWQALFYTYLNNTTSLGNKVNLTLMINGPYEV